MTWEIAVGIFAIVSFAAVGMRYYKDLYYADGDKIYLCTRDDTGSGTILQYTPSQLVGIYFEEVVTDGI